MTVEPIKNIADRIRKRPAMYVGGTDQRGMLQLILEVVANSIDQFLAGKATCVRVEANETTVSVTDDGEGMPFDQAVPGSPDNLATSYLSAVHHSASADGHAPHVHLGGLNGIGFVVSNSLSAEFRCRSCRDGYLWEQSFVRGVALGSARKSGFVDGRGTIITFRPDPEIFGETKICIESLRANAFEAVHLFPGLRFEINQETFQAPNGLGSFVHINNDDNDVQWYRWQDRPAFVVNGVFEDVQISAAAIGFTDTKTEWKTWSNGVQTS
jgi:DNA gyrase subunit B